MTRKFQLFYKNFKNGRGPSEKATFFDMSKLRIAEEVCAAVKFLQDIDFVWTSDGSCRQKSGSD